LIDASVPVIIYFVSGKQGSPLVVGFDEKKSIHFFGAVNPVTLNLFEFNV
jgi:hypothetical protein